MLFLKPENLDHETRLKIIQNLGKQIIKLQRKVNQLKDTCPHVWTETKYGTAKCLGCATHGGWWCPTSPDKQCFYDDNPDDCIYCHQPNERK